MENKKRNGIKSLFSDRRFKYGSLAVGLTAAFVALVVVLNVVIYAFAYTYGWYIDLTGEQYYGITDKSEESLDDVLTEGVKVKIIFCQAKDRVLDDSAGYYIYRCAETYRKAYPNNIQIEFLDIVARPDIAEKYTTQLGASVYTTNVIMETNQSSGHKLLTYNNFYTVDSETGEVYAFNGERRFTSYIISLCTGAPKCYFIEGHGESIYTTAGASSEKIPNALYELMVDAGFDVQTVDLREAGSNLNDAKLVVINNPTSDFFGDGDEGENEIRKLGRFMSDNGGNMLVFLSPYTEEPLEKLKEWLGEWGITVKSGEVNDTWHSLTPEGTAVVCDYPVNNSYAASLHLNLRSMDSQAYTVIRNPLAFTTKWSLAENSDCVYAKNNIELSTVLFSHQSSKLISGETQTEGQQSLAMLARKTEYVGTNSSQTLTSYMFVSSAGYVDEAYLHSNAYGNRDILFQLIVQMGKKLVPIDIDYKVFGSQALAITSAEAYTWTIIFSAVLPTLVCIAGGIVYFKRKRL